MASTINFGVDLGTSNSLIARFEKGDVVVLFSDGVTEAMNAYGEEFGIKRLEGEIVSHRDLPAQRLMESLIAAAEKWTGTSERADDVTVVVARMD